MEASSPPIRSRLPPQRTRPQWAKKSTKTIQTRAVHRWRIIFRMRIPWIYPTIWIWVSAKRWRMRWRWTKDQRMTQWMRMMGNRRLIQSRRKSSQAATNLLLKMHRWRGKTRSLQSKRRTLPRSRSLLKARRLPKTTLLLGPMSLQEKARWIQTTRTTRTAGRAQPQGRLVALPESLVKTPLQRRRNRRTKMVHHNLASRLRTPRRRCPSRTSPERLPMVRRRDRPSRNPTHSWPATLYAVLVTL
ncbi:hypothetical protein B0H14DRAFT_51151 [Mycena olivaceomarginata]|nr:hypothetical protein B0H14DRAFT_51151 [Mycena olivaceomarginata]